MTCTMSRIFSRVHQLSYSSDARLHICHRLYVTLDTWKASAQVVVSHSHTVYTAVIATEGITICFSKWPYTYSVLAILLFFGACVHFRALAPIMECLGYREDAPRRSVPYYVCNAFLRIIDSCRSCSLQSRPYYIYIIYVYTSSH